MRALAVTALFAALALAGCAQSGADQRASGDVVLGPVDGRDLPPTDLDRVRAGDLAPDFSLASLGGPVVTLSEFRGQKNIILVFYRGYW